MNEVTAALVDPAADTSATSTAVVDELAEATERMREASELYSRWRTHPAATRRWPDEAWGTPEDTRSLDDLRGIDLWAMDVTAARMTALSTAAEALSPLVAEVRAGLQERWENRVDQAAAQRLADFGAGVHSWRESAGQLATTIAGARRAVADVLDRWTEEVRAADGRVDDPVQRHAQIDLVDAALAAGHTPLALRTTGVPLGTDPVWASHEVLAWLDDFAARHSAEVARLRRGGQATRDAVERVWQVLEQVLADIPTDLFAALAPAEPPADGTRVTDDPVASSSDGSGAGAASTGGGPSAVGGPGAADTSASTPLAEGPATAAEEPVADQRRAPAAPAGAGGGDSSGGGMRGMPMGGMGGMGGGSGQGGDSERKQSTWRIAGNIFDDKDPAAGFDGIIGVDPAKKQS